jgi:4-amino-4-deoxy-L-arabinose transferase-like glycosyltransferase
MRHALILSVLLAGLVGLVWGRISANPYISDEADYMYAVSAGLRANYTDSPTHSFADFLNTGLGRGRGLAERKTLSEAIRDSGDIEFYRHWHGPVAYYWWIAARAFGLGEYDMRAAMLAFHVATLLVVYFGWLWILPGPAGRLTAVLCSALYVFSYPLVRTSLEIAPHCVFVLCSVASLMFLGKAVQTGDIKYWRWGLAPAAIAFCTLEVAFVLLVTFGVFAWVERKRFFSGWPAIRTLRWLGVSVLLFAAIVFVIWPGAFLYLAFLKSYAVLAYLAVFRKSPWGQVGLFETWWIRLASSPVEWGVILVGVVIFVRKPVRAALPFLVFAVLMMGATLRVLTDSPRYVSPFLPPLQIAAGAAIGNLLAARRLRTAVSIAPAVCAALFVGSLQQGLSHRVGPDAHALAVMSWLREHPLDGRRVLVPQNDLPAIHYYFPRIALRSYADAAELAAAQEQGGFDGVLYTSGSIRYDQVSNR